MFNQRMISKMQIRHQLAVIVIAIAVAILSCVELALAQPSIGMGEQFSPGLVDDLAKKLSQQPYVAEEEQALEALRNLNAQAYSEIKFRPERAFLAESNSLFRAQLYHLGYLYNRSAKVNLVTNAQSYGVPYSPELFNFGRTQIERLPAETGYGGLRLHYPLNKPGVFDEMISFLGASNFRLLSRNQAYGLHARGLSIDTALPSGEEFPYFKEFWIETPAANASAIFVHALLDSPSLTGAYHFKITPGQTSALDISAVIFARKAVKKLGLAPLASMFFHGEGQNPRILEFRPEVHNSDGLLINNGSGEWLWRPLRNPARLAISNFIDRNPRGFGLLQRDRSFDHYQDLKAYMERRPSYWVEPLGDWGEGSVELAEIPSPDETNDNILAYWIPKTPLKGGESRTFSYRLYALDKFQPDRTYPGGSVVASYQQEAGSQKIARRFIIDFAEGELGYYLQQPGTVEAVVTTSSGEIVAKTLEPNPHINGFRVSFDLKLQDNRTADLRVYLRANNIAITETWIYPLTPEIKR